MIQINGLTKIEVELAEAIWSCETKEQVQKLIAQLPTKFLRARAIGLYHTMIIETIDSEMDLEDLELANRVIDSVK